MKAEANGRLKRGNRSKSVAGSMDESPPAAGRSAEDAPPYGAQGGGPAPVPDSIPSREEKIAIIAYYKAERRGFATSGELDDWLEAEREVDREKEKLEAALRANPMLIP